MTVLDFAEHGDARNIFDSEALSRAPSPFALVGQHESEVAHDTVVCSTAAALVDVRYACW